MQTITINIIVVLLVLVSIYTDLKERKIYNAVVVPAALAGIALNVTFNGTEGFIYSMKGLAAGLALLFLPFAFGGVGAGDVKLLGAIGSLTGTVFVFKAFLATGIVGGILAVIVLIRQKRLGNTLQRLFQSFYILVVSVFRVNTLKSLDKAEYHESLPYGLAIGIGTLMAYVVG